jgi:hypothetical protein
MDNDNQPESHWKEDPGEPDGPRKPNEKETPETTPPAIQANTVNEIPAIEMEVHHHPQLEHKHKPWKEYLLEGLMIFVAVMMGFIAENVREGIINREHVKELVSQLVRDMKNDTAQLNGIYLGEKEILDANDSLVELLQLPLKKENTERLLPLIHRSHSLWPFYPSDGAIGAIKNELHLKQFSNSKIIGLIAAYERHVELLHTDQEITLQYQKTYLDPFLFLHFTTASLKDAFNPPHGAKPVNELRNLKQEDMSQLGSNLVLVRTNTEELIINNRRLFANAEELLKYVKEEYHPTEE